MTDDSERKLINITQKTRRKFLRETGVGGASLFSAGMLGSLLSRHAIAKADQKYIDAAITLVRKNAREGLKGKSNSLVQAYQKSGGDTREVLKALRIIDGLFGKKRSPEKMKKAEIDKIVDAGLAHYVSITEPPVLQACMNNFKEPKESDAWGTMKKFGGRQLESALKDKGMELY